MESKTKNKSIIIRSFFGSRWLIILLLTLTIFSILSKIIPAVDVFDPFWFGPLMFFLALNLSICFASRVNIIWNFFRSFYLTIFLLIIIPGIALLSKFLPSLYTLLITYNYLIIIFLGFNLIISSIDRFDSIWNFFSSVKLTIALLIILAIASILGTFLETFIPQRQEAIEFAKRLSPDVLRLFTALDLFDLYHSYWFRSIVGLLALNLIICSLDRFPGAWKRIRTKPRPDRSKPFENLPANYAFRVPVEGVDPIGTVGDFLRGRYKMIEEKASGQNHFFYGEKGRYSHYGVYLVHLSVLLIIIGALLGSFFGFEAYVNIREGEQTGIVTHILKKKMVPLKLGFEVRLDRFFVEFYENGAPKEFRSDLSFIEKGKPVKKGSLLVNHPIQFRGKTFYQSNWGKAPGKRVRLKIERVASGYEGKDLMVEKGKPYPLPGNEGQFRVAHVREDFMNMGPAVLITIQPKQGEEKRLWVFHNHELAQKKLPRPMRWSPKFNPSAFKPYTFCLEGMEFIYYSGIKIAKDPGVSIVWLGCFLMVSGFIVTFFMSHRRIWVRVAKKAEGYEVSLAGSANRNQVGFQREMERLKGRVKKLFDSKG